LIQADVLNVRPRVTELVQLGLARLVRKERREGVYEAIPIFEARKQLEQQSAEEAKRHGEQLQLI
jgi:phage baseplate assembly protein W